MCNCSKPVTQSECDQIREFVADGRFFIYNISDTEGLRVAYVPNGENPNKIAAERGFFADDGITPEWYNVREHPCLNDD